MVSSGARVEGEVGARVGDFLVENVVSVGLKFRFLYRPPQRPLPALISNLFDCHHSLQPSAYFHFL